MSEQVQAVSTPVKAAPSVIPPVVATNPFENLSNEDLCVKFAREVIRRGLIVLERKEPKTKGATAVVWGGWGVGVGQWPRRSLTLTPIQARELTTVHGVPMAMSLEVSVVDVVPQANAEAHRKEREVMTAERNTRKADSLPDSVLLEALNRKRIAKGEEPLTEL